MEKQSTQKHITVVNALLPDQKSSNPSPFPSQLRVPWKHLSFLGPSLPIPQVRKQVLKNSECTLGIQVNM